MGLARQFWLLRRHARPEPLRIDQPIRRLARVLVQGVLQRNLRLSWPGLAHAGIFFGFLTFVPRTLVLLGRAFDPGFGTEAEADFGVVARAEASHVVHSAYAWLKDSMAILVLLGILVFACLRVGRYRGRLEPKPSALGILAAIGLMMIADLLYDGAGFALAERGNAPWPARIEGSTLSLSEAFLVPFAHYAGSLADLASLSPMTRVLATWLGRLEASTLADVGLICYCLHLGVVGVFLIALPHTKHFHLVTVWPKLFLADRERAATPTTVARTAEALLERVEHELETTESCAGQRSSVGQATLADFSPWERLDWFACTQCGRCTEQCPAAATGKPLDPRELTLQLRTKLERMPFGAERSASDWAEPLVPRVLSADALWACTQCGACEAACPVGVRYVNPILELRRHRFLMRGEAPRELARVSQSLERRHNPYGFPHDDRAKWAAGLGVPLLKDVQRVEYLYWVGCAASYDPRAQAVARAFVRILQRARIRFAILGPEERCTGDAARRAGNELLYLQLASHNVQVLDRYQSEGRFQRVITTCPHCLIALGRQYRDIGGNYEVVSHVVAIERWMKEGRLPRPKSIDQQVAYHDPCNLARSAHVIDAPRRILDAIPGLRLTQPQAEGEKTFCCGGGGGQAWLEQPGERIQQRRVNQLLATGAECIVSACPFCLTLLDDGLKGATHTKRPNVYDVAELVELSDPANGSDADQVPAGGTEPQRL